MIFVSQTAPELKAAIVSESFLEGAGFSTSPSNNAGDLVHHDLRALQQQAAGGELIRLDAPACINTFSGAFETGYSAVLLISNLDSPTSPLVQTSGVVSAVTIADLTSNHSSIQYCLAQRGPAATCEVCLNTLLLGIVALLNSILLVATASVLFKRSSFRPLATLGDAISSFLEEPDPTTQGACLLSKADVRQGRWHPTGAKYWIPRDHYWLRSVSGPRWLVTGSIWTACVGLAAAGLGVAIANDPVAGLSPFGVSSPHALIRLPQSVLAQAAAMVASLPQGLLAVLYLAVDAHLTTYFLSHESSRFATAPPRPLRVSADPVGLQTTSVYLTLPPAVSWFLAVLFAGMAFLLSQSLFVVSVQLIDVPVSPGSIPTDDEGLSGSPNQIVALGLSGVALLVLLASLLVLAVAVLGVGLRRSPSAQPPGGEPVGNPMALAGGSCSAVISARCHPLAREKGLWRKPVMWGVVREGACLGESHCGFTAGRPGVVNPGVPYA